MIGVGFNAEANAGADVRADARAVLGGDAAEMPRKRDASKE